MSSVSELKTSVGGSRGFSGLGYVNVDEMLTVIHSGGGCISELSGDSDAECKEEGARGTHPVSLSLLRSAPLVGLGCEGAPWLC